MFYEPPAWRKVLHLIVSGLILILLIFAADVLGFLDAPHDLELTMSVVLAIWLAIWVILFVVITRVGRHPKVDRS
jgi:hypothetical protein